MKKKEEPTSEEIEELIAWAKRERRDWAKRIGAELVAEEDDGNIELWEYGKKHSRTRETVNYVTATKLPSWHQSHKSYKDELIDTKEFAETRLLEDWDIQPDEFRTTEDGSYNNLYVYLNNSTNPNSKYKSDDVPTLLAKMIFIVDMILNKVQSHDIQLRYAQMLGHTISHHNYICKTAPRNQVRAQGERQPGINNILRKLSKKEDKHRDLWDEFIGCLEQELEAEVTRKKGNHNDPKTWSINIRYSPEQDKEVNKPYTFNSFSSALSKFKSGKRK